MANKVILTGNLGRDPELRTTQGGDKVATLNLATTEHWKDKASGERRERTEWHTVVVFGGLAGVAERFLRKGSKVYVEGQLRTRKWERQVEVEVGKTKKTVTVPAYSTEVVVSQRGTLELLDRKPEGNGQGGWEPPADYGDEEIPF